LTPQQILETLKMQPHPEGGHFVEVYRHEPGDGGRGLKTAIYFLLQAGEVSAWHRVDAVEIWHWYAGSPLVLTISENGHDARAEYLGPDILANQRPMRIVPENAWQTAESLGAWTLVGCTVAPAFQFDGFELAPPDWRPTPRG
jgi:hypothetical protein